MAKNVKAKITDDLESRVTMLEERIVVIEKLSKRFTRKKREYTDEQKAAIRARLLAGQEAARKRREGDVKVIPDEKAIKKMANTKPTLPVKPS